MAFLDEIAAKLVADGLGIVGTNLFVSSKGKIPEGIGPYTSLVETGGTAPTRTHNARRATQRPSAQILVRASTFPVARAKAWAIYQSLDGLFNVTLSSTFYLSITAAQEPTDLGLDDAGRPRVAFNINAEKQPS